MDAWIAGGAGRTKDQWLAHTLVQCSSGPPPAVQDGTYTQVGNHWTILDGAGTRAAANRVLWPIVAPPETYFAAWTTYFAKLFSMFLASYEGQEGAAESDGEVRLPLNQQSHQFQILFGADRFVSLPGYQSLFMDTGVRSNIPQPTLTRKDYVSSLNFIMKPNRKTHA